MRKGNKLFNFIHRIDYFFNKYFPKYVKNVNGYYVLDPKFFWIKKKVFQFVNFFFNLELVNLFYICGSDKFDNYQEAYNLIENNFNKKKNIKILEIGIGGHNLKFSGGASLLALSLCFKNAKVVGADLFDKKFLDDDRISTVIADQNDVTTFKKITEEFGKFDLIIDDGSHFVDHQMNSFNFFYEQLNDNGIYVIEDTSGSYKVREKGSPYLEKEKNLLTYFGRLSHCVNYNYLIKNQQKIFEKYKDIHSLFFFKDCILIKKTTKLNTYLDESDANLEREQRNLLEKVKLKKHKLGYHDIAMDLSEKKNENL